MGSFMQVEQGIINIYGEKERSDHWALGDTFIRFHPVTRTTNQLSHVVTCSLDMNVYIDMST